MARRPRIVVEGGLYHAYNRVSSGEPIFADPNDSLKIRVISIAWSCTFISTR